MWMQGTTYENIIKDDVVKEIENLLAACEAQFRHMLLTQQSFRKS